MQILGLSSQGGSNVGWIRSGGVMGGRSRRIGLSLLAGIVLLPAVAVGPVAAEDVGEADVPVAPQIFNGSNVPSDNPYAWTVALLIASEPNPKEAFHCGGTLIAPTWVLTAAQCVKDGSFSLAPSQLNVAVGGLDLTTITSSSRLPVKAIMVHPQYNESTFRNDVALLELTSAVAGVEPAYLIQPGRALPAGTSAWAIGWGEDVAGNAPNRLRFASVQIAAGDTSSTCGDWTSTQYRRASMVCAGGTGTQNTAGICVGDGGGPLVVSGPRGWELAGVASIIGIRGLTRCNASGLPGIFARVSSLTPWICERTRRFVDVPYGEYYDANAHELWRLGVTTGTSASCEYSPSQSVTRSQMALFMWRLVGTPASSNSCGLSDVPSTASYAAAACWLLREGITTNNPYKPGGVVTRGQMAAFLWRLAGEPAAPTSCGFSDERAIRADFRQATCWLKATGVTTSDPYKPGDRVTRAQMAAFLIRVKAQL